jgi:hypothetical protein
VVSAEKQLTMPLQKKSKKNAPTENDREEHHHDEDNGISRTPEPSHIIDQERRAKLRISRKQELRRQHTLEQLAEQDAHENDDDDDDEAVDKELEMVNIRYINFRKRKNNSRISCKKKEKLQKS